MKREFVVNEKPLEIRVKRRRGMRRLALSISGDGDISLTAPRSTPIWFIERFLQKQADWIERTLAKLHLTGHDLSERRARERQEYLEHREQARKFILSRLAELNRAYGFRYGRVSIRNQHSRWGSCSANGNLSFNYRILFLPPELADYVFVHELAHLRELNHSPRFWSVVAATIPDYKERRRALQALHFHVPVLPVSAE